LQNVIT